MDEADYAQEKIDATTENATKQAQAAVAQMPEGTQGDCDLCGYWSGRLVSGACAPCRDRYKLS